MNIERTVSHGARIEGTCDARFASVLDAFTENFERHDEVGASLCVSVGGQTLVDLWGGFCDIERRQAWNRDTVGIVYSCTKAATALCAHRLIDQGLLERRTPMDRSKQFRDAAALENEGRERTGWRYSAELKRLAVELVDEGRESGVPWSQLSGDLGVSALTLSRWAKTTTPPRFRPVQVVDSEDDTDVEPSSLAVVTPSGLRIEGLAWSQVLEVMRIFR